MSTTKPPRRQKGEDGSGKQIRMSTTKPPRRQKGEDGSNESTGEPTKRQEHPDEGVCDEEHPRDCHNDSDQSPDAFLWVQVQTIQSTINDESNMAAVGMATNGVPSLSTVHVTVKGPTFPSGLCNHICRMLRKHGHGVVNDRFQKREYLMLPRSVRNLIKSKLCITCHRIEWEEQINEQQTKYESKSASILPPDRLSARYWRTHLNSQSNNT